MHHPLKAPLVGAFLYLLGALEASHVMMRA